LPPTHFALAIRLFFLSCPKSLLSAQEVAPEPDLLGKAGRSRDFVVQRDGVLFLGVNEGNLSDNSGNYDVVIEAEAIGGNPR